jgi:hypothetical protein
MDDGNCEGTEAEKYDGKGEHSETSKANFKKETKLMYNTFSNIYFLSHVCSKIMKLIHKITFSTQICFLVQ